MKFTFISDTHNDHHLMKIDHTDILVHCGDACVRGNYTEGKDFLWWLVKQPAAYKIFVPGNHDEKLKNHNELIYLAYDLGIIVLIDDLVVIDSIKIYGVSKTFKQIGSLNRDGKVTPIEERIDAYKNIPKGLDILLTHMPPFGILDESINGINVGCPILAEKVLDARPKLHIFGHIHEFAGKNIKIGSTEYYNVCNKNVQYEIINPYGLKLNL